MSPTLAWITAAAVLAGHFGLMLSGYNRINGFGWQRRTVKRCTKVMFAFTLLWPPIAIWMWQGFLSNWVTGNADLSSTPTLLAIYSVLCLLAWPMLGIPWLYFRPIFGVEAVTAPRQTEVVPVQQAVSNRLALTRKCKFESRLPINQVFDLSIDQIDLPVAHLPAELDGYRIAHLSDIHLTGDIHPDFAGYAVQRATQWDPHLMAITGDIIDKQPCIDWLGQIFAPARARDGCYFVLGNHDTRVVDSWQTRDAMDRAGWTDLGSRGLKKKLGGVDSLLIGNEYPWFQRPLIDAQPDQPFRLLLSHSPDQFGWARRHNVTLMLAGHTHGGQGRLPLAGPLLSPSFHGSRYASGDFYRAPTTMHVTRGLAGTHLIRINCRPELSLLTLRAA
ncbi:putative metallophosphoesterase [Rubripirellula lacrimiformis]|uniref:Putative metallophosphoesterase n=1 Tax=Rubripirellula lacrimiformis TaxID=1930273 RepID=A0A517NKN1_9BACT|nr:metallophosphoesterase [Rubripirellula lacrimiformis]QDT07691.1 putative metallophosphoesterase [Rubripirellula lacrimiformis]